MELQDELRVNYCHLAVVSTDPPEITDAFRIGLCATFTFLSDYGVQVSNVPGFFSRDCICDNDGYSVTVMTIRMLPWLTPQK